MTAGSSGAPLLDAAHADFLQHHVSISVASRSVEHMPSLARGLGCRVSADRRTVTVFLSRPHSGTLLDDLRTGGGIAVVVSRPSTHETLQLKGARASVEPLANGDRERLQACGRSFAEDIRSIGHRDPFVSAVMSVFDGEVVAVTFTPTEIFVQTPGPTAGQRLVAP